MSCSDNSLFPTNEMHLEESKHYVTMATEML